VGTELVIGDVWPQLIARTEKDIGASSSRSLQGGVLWDVITPR